MEKLLEWVEPEGFQAILLQHEKNISKITNTEEKAKALEMLTNNYKLLVNKLLEKK